MKVSDQHREPLVPIYGKCPTKWGECPIQKPSILIGELNTVRLPQLEGYGWIAMQTVWVLMFPSTER